MTRIFLLLSSFLFLVSCEQVVDIGYNPEQKACLNGVLNPDSIIHLSLYYTQAIDNNNAYEAIDNADISLFENGVELAKPTHLDMGEYELAVYPKINAHYRILVNIGADLQLSAETTVPPRPVIDTMVVERTKNPNWRDVDSTTHYYYLTVDYQINDSAGESFYWNYELFWYWWGKRYNFPESISYFTPQADNFNREIDSEQQLGYYYHFYVRQTDSGADGTSWKFRKEMTTNDKDCFFCADEHYDRYLKSSVQSWIVEEWQELPFSDPVVIYSNVENGAGIFGSASFTYINYRDE